jgi:hypothetical protein
MNVLSIDKFVADILLPRCTYSYSFFFLRELRKGTGVVGDTVTQLHAWWHLFAGMGTYMHLIVRLVAIFIFKLDGATCTVNTAIDHYIGFCSIIV